MSVAYYDKNAFQFFNGTFAVNMTSSYCRFLPFVPAGGSILDAGCGSGRDSLYFKVSGYKVTAIDASKEMSILASEATGLNVINCELDQFLAPSPFDGIWACASLLHTPERQLKNTMSHLISLLADGGVFYLSFKHGSGEHVIGERTFTNLNEDGLKAILADLPVFIIDSWISRDARPEKQHELWCNAVLKKSQNHR